MEWLRLAFATYKYWIIIGVVVLVLGLLWAYVTHAERAKERLAVAEYQLGQALDAANTNANSLAVCRAANAANAAEAQRLHDRVQEAVIRLAAASTGANRDVETINREANTHRAMGAACPAINADFRLWMRGDT